MQQSHKLYLGKLLQIFVTLLLVFIFTDIIGLISITFFSLKASSIASLILLDLIVSLLTLIFFILSIYLNKEDQNYLRRNWPIFLACIPFDFIFYALTSYNPTFIPLVFLRFLHVLGLLFTIWRTSSGFIKFSKKTGLGYGIILLTAVFLIGSGSFVVVEKPVNPNVQNFEDAMWYMVTTMTTTGYGDIVPVTGMGRIIGSLAMIAGLAFTGYATASVATAIIDRFNKEREKDRKKYEEIRDHDRDNLRILVEKSREDREQRDEELKTLLKEILDKLDK